MDRVIKNTDLFKDKLYKLIPAEVIAAYIAIQGLLSGQPAVIIQIVIGVLVLLTFLHIHIILGVEDLKHKLFQTATFLVWVYAIAPIDIIGPTLHNPQVASIVLILWTLLIPLVVGIPPQTDDNP